jgi:hypothetical protein
VAGLDARGSGHQNRAMSFRRPLVALAVGVLMLIVALLLDRGGEGSRDMALLIGTAALYVVLPASVLWLIAVAISRGRSGSGRGKPG